VRSNVVWYAGALSALERILAILSAGADYRPRIPPSAVGPETRFKEDLGLDSLALMSLAAELDEHYEGLDEMEIARWITVADCTRYLDGLSRR
jgi:acyl carrier protein